MGLVVRADLGPGVEFEVLAGDCQDWRVGGCGCCCMSILSFSVAWETEQIKRGAEKLAHGRANEDGSVLGAGYRSEEGVAKEAVHGEGEYEEEQQGE